MAAAKGRRTLGGPCRSLPLRTDRFIHYSTVIAVLKKFPGIQALDRALANRSGLEDVKGLLVSWVSPGGNAGKAGLCGGDPGSSLTAGGHTVYLGGDVITHVERLPVWTLMDLLGALESTRPDKIVRLEVRRGDRTLTVRIVLAERSPEM